MADVTFIILTKNEEINIEDCLKSIRDFAKRIVLVDSGSTDRTCEIAERMGAEVLTHPFETHARQFNWGLDNANITTRWTFRLDADERLTPALCDELAELMEKHSQDDINGVAMEARLWFLGREMKHGGHQKRKLMLFKTGIGRVEDRKMDEHTILSQGRVISCKEKFIHYDFKDLTFWARKMNWYATREAQDYFDYISGAHEAIESNDAEISSIRNKKFGIYYRFPKFLRCKLMFLYVYIFQLGFLDGKEGFIYHYLYHDWYRTLVDAKIVEHELLKQPFDENTELK